MANNDDQYFRNLVRDFSQQKDILLDAPFDNDAFVEFAAPLPEFSNNKWQRELKLRNLADFATMFDFFTVWLNIDDSNEELSTVTDNLHELVQHPKSSIFKNYNWKPTDKLNDLRPLSIQDMLDVLK